MFFRGFTYVVFQHVGATWKWRMSLLLASELSAAKLHAAASNDVFEGLSEQDSKLAQVGAHGWRALSTPWFWVGHSRPNEQAKVEELTRQMLHSKPAERISVTELKRTGSQVGRSPESTKMCRAV